MNTTDLFTAIVTKYNDSSAAAVELRDMSKGIWYSHAPQNQNHPFITYFMIASSPKTYLLNTEEIGETKIQFDVWSDSSTPFEAVTIADRVKDLFDISKTSANLDIGYIVNDIPSTVDVQICTPFLK